MLTADASGDVVADFCGRIVKFLPGQKGHITVQFQTDDGRLLVVSGKLPVADKGFRYRFRARRVMSKGRATMEIVCMLEPAFEPLPVSGAELRDKLWRWLKYPMADATRIAMEVSQPFLDATLANQRLLTQLQAAQIPVQHLFEHHATEPWFLKLAGLWKPIQYRHFPLLCKFWSHWDLQELHLHELQYIVDSLRQSPLQWFLPGHTDTGLAPIPLAKAHLLPSVLGISLSADDSRVISCYNAIHNQLEAQKTLCLFKSQISAITCGLSAEEKQQVLNRISVTSGMSEAKRRENYDLLAITYEPGFGAGYYHRKRDYVNKLLIKRRLTHLLTSAPSNVAKNARFAAVSLNPEQSTCVRRVVSEQNIIIIVGDAGTGKTHVGKAIFDSFDPRVVLPLAMYGEVANKMRRVYGKGMTIDMFLERVRRRTKLGMRLRELIEVVILDEIGVVTEDKLAGLLAALPRLKVFVGMGDGKQLTPVAAGPILKSMLRKWGGTSLVQELVQNHRVDENSQVLLSNFRSYILGDIKAIQYTNSIAGLNPFHVIQRAPYPEACLFPAEGDLANHHRRMLHMKGELEPIYKALVAEKKDLRTVRILAQRGEDVSKLNQAWFQLEHEGKLKYAENVFYPGSLVCFQKNMNFKRFDWTDQIACSSVSNNTTARIKEIYDINPRTSPTKAFENRKKRDSTADKKYNEQWLRVILFEDDTKINLRDYPLRWLAYGYATTVASAIGYECAIVIGWIQPGHVHIYRETLYTMMTRASERVYLICDLKGDPTLYNSDIGWIYRKPAPEVENVLVNYLPDPAEVASRNNDLSSSDEIVIAERPVFPLGGGLSNEINLGLEGFEMSDSDENYNYEDEGEDENEELVSNAVPSKNYNDALELFALAEQGMPISAPSRTETCSSPQDNSLIQQFNSNW